MARRIESLNDPQHPNDRKSGRAVYEAKGTVWEWQTSTGVFQRDVSSDQLFALSETTLSIVEPEPTVTSAGWIYQKDEGAVSAKAVRSARPAKEQAKPSIWKRLRGG